MKQNSDKIRLNLVAFIVENIVLHKERYRIVKHKPIIYIYIYGNNKRSINIESSTSRRLIAMKSC